MKIHSVNGQTKMLPRLIEMLTRRMLTDIASGTSSQGVITFANHDYLVTIRKVRKRRWSNLFGLLKVKG